MIISRTFCIVSFLGLLASPIQSSLHAKDNPTTDHGAPYKLIQTFDVGGDGRWDFITVDAEANRLYVPRSNHVQVLDAGSGKQLADWADTTGVHGVAIVTARNLAFTSDGGSDSVGVFDLKTDKKIAAVKAGKGPDAIVYDQASGNVLTFNHKGGTVTFIAVGAGNDFQTRELEVGGALEVGVVDGAGHAFVNVEDKNEVVEIDTKAVKVLNRWKIAGGEGPTGLAIDTQNHRLFVGCGENNVMAVMDSENGTMIATLPIGERCDGCEYDRGTASAFASCGDGTIAVVKHDGDKYAVAQTVQTKPGARTIAVDTKVHRIYLPTAEFLPAESGKRPVMKPNTFQIIVVGQ